MKENVPRAPRKKRGCLTTLLIFIVIIVIIIGGGLFYFNMQKPEEVSYTQADVDAFYEKMAIAPGDYTFNMIDFMEGKVVSEGRKNVDQLFTSEEITGGFQSSASYVVERPPLRTTQTDILTIIARQMTLDVMAAEDISGVEKYSSKSIFGDISIRFTGPNELELIATPTEGFKIIYDYAPKLANYDIAVDRVIGALVYVKMTATYTGNSLMLDATSVSINGIPVPLNLIDPYEDDVSSQLNWALNQVDGLDIEIMTITEEGFRFKGTVPASIRNLEN